MKKYFTVFLILFLFHSVYSQTQVISRLKQPPPNRFGISDLWSIDLNNTTRKEIKGYIVGTLSEDNDGLIVEARTKIFTIRPGNNTYTQKDFPNADVNYYNNRYKEILLRTGGAPDGDYTICITVYNESDEIIGQENCIFHSVRIAVPITLISPDDDEIVNTEQPILFSWSPLPETQKYNIKIVEVLDGQSPFVAIEQNRPLVEKNIFGSNSFQLSQSEVKSFLRGSERKDIRRTFAWQVKAGESQSDVYVWKCCKSALTNNNELDSLEIVVFNLCGSKNVNVGENPTKVMDKDCNGHGNLVESLLEIFNDESFVSEFKKVFTREQQNGILWRIIDHEGIHDTINLDNKKVRFRAGAELADRVKKAVIDGGRRIIGAGQVTEILKLANQQSNSRNLLVFLFADNEEVWDLIFPGDNTGNHSDSTSLKMNVGQVTTLLLGADFEESGAVTLVLRQRGGEKIENIISNTFKNNDWNNITYKRTSASPNLVIKTKSLPYKIIKTEAQKKNFRITLLYPEGQIAESNLDNFQSELEEFVRILIADEVVKPTKKFTVTKQTQGATFGERVNAGLINFIKEENSAELGEEILILFGTPTSKTVPCPPEGCGCTNDGGVSCSCKHWPGNTEYCLCKLCPDIKEIEMLDILPPPNSGNGITTKDILIILKSDKSTEDKSVIEIGKEGLNKVSQLRKNNIESLIIKQKYQIGVNEPGVN
ncbi:hypothetical protein [Ignavibacterium sp.]|uniref:hypothetical protein n=1 Tax=Ignavibacterium sp. TaxID=2651167 RepID=UPI0021F96BDF|nr:hypothetical protein [Ignavibacterium sp.]BDQ02472.1 MAG: hypothetical protein KatS3mg037_1047 [Ignavibacterium sp.]